MCDVLCLVVTKVLLFLLADQILAVTVLSPRMSTSLARQLALLRTPGSVKASLATSSVYSGPFLFPEAETEHSSLASLKGCVADSLSSLCQIDPQLTRFSILLELDEEEAEARSLVKECLTFLCPHILNKSAQWLLQWLISKHKV